MQGRINLRTVVFIGGYAVAVIVGTLAQALSRSFWVGVVAFGVTALAAYAVGISLRETGE